MALAPTEIGRRLRAVRTELGIDVSVIAAACGVSHEVYSQLELGALDPVPGDYILIASRILKTDFRYFISELLDNVENGTRRVFRALADRKPADLLAIRRFMLFCMAERDLEKMLDMPPQALPPKYPRAGSSEGLLTKQGQQAAFKERERLSLGDQPIPNVFAVLREQGIRLYRHTLGDHDLSGVTVAHPEAGVCVLLNYEDDLFRQFFSAAHEYAHVLFDREAIATSGCIVSYRYSRKELVEQRANAFAAEFLLPTAAMSKYAKPKSLDEASTTIGAIARDYFVNTEIVAIRMKQLKWIGDRALASFRKVKPVVIRRGEKIDPDIPRHLTVAQAERFEIAFQHGIGSRLLELLRRGLTEHAISFGRFAEMLDMTGEEAHEFIQSLGMAT